MKKITKILAALIFGASLLVAAPVMAISYDDFNKMCEKADDETKSLMNCDKKGNAGTLGNVFSNLTYVALSVVGIIATIVIVLGGQRYITSAGDAGKAKQAKDMIVYGVVGLVVAILAWAILAFVSQNIQSQQNKGVINIGVEKVLNS